MKTLLKSLLSRNLKERDSQNFGVSNIKPRLKGLRRLKYIFATALLLGYYPTVNFSPTSHGGEVLAAEQVAEVKSDALPYSFTLPHPGYLSTPFSAYHPGVDIATGLGMIIHPIAPGKVLAVDWGFFGLGHAVYISHPDEFESVYGHLGRVFVRVGDSVNQNSILGEVGLTGHTSGPHTHLEIHKNGKSIDPQTVLPAIPHFPSLMDFQPVGGPELPDNLPGSTNLRKTLRPDFS